MSMESTTVGRMQGIVKTRRWLPPLIFVLMMMGVITITYLISASAQSERRDAFEDELGLVERATRNRSNIYINALRSGIGLFRSSDSVTRDEWAKFVDSLELQENFPGIQGFGYAEYVSTAKKADHEKRVRADGFPDYAIKPTGVREEYTSIIFIEPFDDRNSQAFGYDMLTEETRRAAMQQARDTGEVTMSGRVTLVQEIDADVQAGFLIYVPLYRKDAQQDTIEQRRDALQGYVYAPFRAENFMAGLLGQERSPFIDFAIFDGSVQSYDSSRLMYDSSGGTREYRSDDRFYEKREMTIAGRTWTIIATARPELTPASAATNAPIVFFVVGTLFSIIVSYLLYFLSNSRERAIDLATSMTVDLRRRTEESEKNEKALENANAELEKKTAELSETIAEVEKINEYMVNREEKMIELKRELKNR